MANNRMYMRCRTCGDCLYLGKTYSDGYFYVNYRKEEGSLEDQLNRFFDEHHYCGRERGKRPTAYDEEVFPLPDHDGCFNGSFDLVYENTWGTEYEQEE